MHANICNPIIRTSLFVTIQQYMCRLGAKTEFEESPTISTNVHFYPQKQALVIRTLFQLYVKSIAAVQPSELLRLSQWRNTVEVLQRNVTINGK